MDDYPPNFFVIGVAKAGTSSLNRYLDAHPQIFMCPRKEPRYFALKDKDDTSVLGPNGERLDEDGVTQLGEYESLFEDVQDEKAVGDNSPRYMESEVAARNIYEAVPNAKFIAILRDPVDRSYSHFQMNVRSLVEQFPEFDSPTRRAEYLTERLSDPFYVRMGQYHEQLKRYLDFFDRDQICILFFEDLKNKPEELIQSTYSFLGVDTTFFPEYLGKTYNKGGTPRFMLIQELIKDYPDVKRALRVLVPDGIYNKAKWYVYDLNQGEAPNLPDSTRQQLITYYEDDIRRLEKEIGTDLSRWIS